MNSIQLIAAAAIAAHNALIHSAVSLGTTPQSSWDAQSQEKRDTAIAGATLIWRAPGNSPAMASRKPGGEKNI